MKSPVSYVLDAEQEYAWAVEPSRPVFPMLALETGRKFTPVVWQNAHSAVLQKYPALSGRIDKDAGERPRLVLGDQHIPQCSLEHVPAHQTLRALMEREALVSFGLGDRTLSRLVVGEGETSTFLVFAAHHAICDGYSNALIVRDLLLAAEGKSVGSIAPPLPSLGELLGLGQPTPYTQTLAEPFSPGCDEQSFPPARMDFLRLEGDVLDRLRRRARQEQSTIQAVLIVALYTAGKYLRPRWQKGSLLCLSPADLRPVLGLGQHPGVLLATLPTQLNPAEDHFFWDKSRQITAGLKSMRTLEAAKEGQKQLRQFFSREVDPCRRETIDLRAFHHDLMVTNLGVVDVLFKDIDFELRQIYQAVASGTSEDAQIVSALTLNDVLFLNHVSRDPIEGLLPQAESILLQAVAG